MVFIAALLCLCVLAPRWFRMFARKRKPSARAPRAAEEGSDGGATEDLFETAPIGYMEIDRKGIVRRVNRLECKLRGLEAERHAGRALRRADS